jgi:membrane-associated protease RseP (regulator of RpoE activity)
LVNDTAGLTQAIRSTTPNSTVPMALIRDGSSLSINFTLGTSASQSNLSYIGINTYNYYAPKASFTPVWGPFYLFGALNWLYILSLNIGLINLFPVPSLDGDQLFRVFAEFMLRNNKRAAAIGNIIRWGALAVLVLSILLSFILFPGFTFG